MPSSSGYSSTIFVVVVYPRILTAVGPVGGEGIAPPPHDDDELLFKSRVILLFKIPIPKLLHARALALAHKEKGCVVDDLLFVCLFVGWLVGVLRVCRPETSLLLLW